MKVLKVRLQNERDRQVFFREIVLDGKRVTARSASLHLDSKVEKTFARSGERFASVEEARGRFDRLVAESERNYKKKTVEEVERPDRPEGFAPFFRNPELAAQVMSGGEAPAAVYADWLQSQGDIRGELAALHLAGKGGDATNWLEKNAEAVLGELDVKLESEIYDLVFRHGFLRGASLKRGGVDSNTDLAVLTASFLDVPLADFVDQLRFGLASYESDNDWSGTVGAVASSRLAPQIRVLRFDDYTSDECEISWTPFGDFSDAWSRLPALEEIHIRSGAGGTLGEIRSTSLRKLVRESGGLSRAEIASLVSADCPRLEHLEIWLGAEGYGAEGTVDDVAPLFDGQRFPNLVHLGLCNAEITHHLLAPLAASPLLRRLRVLDLSKGVLMDDDVDVLLEHATAFAHLQRLDLSENLFEKRGPEIAARLPGVEVVLHDQRFDGDDYRYAAVGE